MDCPEERARANIDRPLTAAGWQVQDRSRANLGVAVGAAVREFPLATGEAGCLLFVIARRSELAHPSRKAQPSTASSCNPASTALDSPNDCPRGFALCHFSARAPASRPSSPVDDIPVLLISTTRLGLAELVDQHFEPNGNWQGRNPGRVLTGWLACTHILSEGDHRLNRVQDWVAGRWRVLQPVLGAALRALDFTDDRLAIGLDPLSGDAAWTAFEAALNQRTLRVYARAARAATPPEVLAQDVEEALDRPVRVTICVVPMQTMDFP